MNELTPIFFSSLATSKVSRVYLLFQSDLDSLGAASVLLQMLELLGIPTHYYCLEFPYEEACQTVVNEMAEDKKGAVIVLSPFDEMIKELLPQTFLPEIYTLSSEPNSLLQTLEEFETEHQLVKRVRDLINENSELLYTLAHHGYYRNGIDITLKGIREELGSSYSLLGDAERSHVLKKAPTFYIKDDKVIKTEKPGDEISGRGHVLLIKKFLSELQKEDLAEKYLFNYKPNPKIPGVFPPLGEMKEYSLIFDTTQDEITLLSP